MKTVELATASKSLVDLADGLSDEIVVLTRGEKLVAAVVPLKDADRESIALSAHPGFLKIIARSRSQFRRGRTLSLAEMRASFAEAGASEKRRRSAALRRKRSGTA